MGPPLSMAQHRCTAGREKGEHFWEVDKGTCGARPYARRSTAALMYYRIASTARLWAEAMFFSIRVGVGPPFCTRTAALLYERIAWWAETLVRHELLAARHCFTAG